MRSFRSSVRHLIAPLSVVPLLALGACGDSIDAADASASAPQTATAEASAASAIAYGDGVLFDSAQINSVERQALLGERGGAALGAEGSSIAATTESTTAGIAPAAAQTVDAPIAVQAASAPVALAALTPTQRAAAQCAAETPAATSPVEPAAPSTPVIVTPPVVVTPPVLPTTSGGYASNSAEANRLYGPGARIMDGLWNINAQRISGNDTFAAIRFRAPVSGPVASVRLYWSDGSGYAAGNGGDIALRLLPDDGSARHLPNWSATPLATGRRVPGSLSMSGGTYTTAAHRFSADTLSGSGQLEAGKLYHLVAINNASNPTANWSSLDMAWTVKANGQSSRWVSPYDFSALYGKRPVGSSATPTWEDWTVGGHGGAYVVPIMQMTMASGQSFGNSNMETGNVDASGRVWKNANANPVRERFTPKQSRTITGLSIHTAKSSGSGGLGWQIVQGSTVLASGTIDQSSANYRVDGSVGNTGVMAWYDVALPSSVTLKPNTTYDVVFTPQGSSVWVFADQRNGGSYGFSNPAAFTESQAQHYLNGKWLDANHWTKSSSSGGSNWRVVLHQSAS